jgi:hypothetical protein
MKLLDYLDRIGQRRLERWKISPRRPIDWRSFIGLAFLAGYYLMVLRFIGNVVPAENIPLVRDSMLVLGPAVGAVVQSLFRSDVRDEIQASNTGEGFRAMRTQAEATVAAAAGTPATGNGEATHAADAVADAAADEATRIRRDENA